MNILVTGSNGFIGRNLVSTLRNIKDDKDHRSSDLDIDNIFEYDVDTDEALLDFYCKNADFVFNLAGVNRPKESSEFLAGNFDFASTLLNALKKHNNYCPVMLASSIQASLYGPYEGSDYGRSKLLGEQLFFDYSASTGSKVLVYRFSNVFGKWSRPNYNSVIATFCNNIAKDLPIHVDDPSILLNLIYIDDLMDEMIRALIGRESHCYYDGLTPVESFDGQYCFVPVFHKSTLGHIVDLLNQFKSQSCTNFIPDIPKGSFEKKLFSTYLSFLPSDSTIYPLDSHRDTRGSFTEIIKTSNSGQVSINVSKPGITKGQHWHHSKWEIFVVVSGVAKIQERNLSTDEEREFIVSDDDLQAVYMLPGYTHNITNLSQNRDLVTLIWANEPFSSVSPDTYYEEV